MLRLASLLALSRLSAPASASLMHAMVPLETPPTSLLMDLPCLIALANDNSQFFTVCLFRNITQTLGTPSAPTRSVSLGTFANWTTVPCGTSCPPVPSKQIYQNGDVCPGFGNRYSLVAFECGSGTTNVTSVVEYDVCKYIFTVALGAWCAEVTPGATPSPSSTQQLTPSPACTVAPNAPAASSAPPLPVYTVASISAAVGMVVGLGAGVGLQRFLQKRAAAAAASAPSDDISVPNPASASSLRPAAGDVASLWQTAAEGGGGGAAADARAKALREALLVNSGAPAQPAAFALQ